MAEQRADEAHLAPLNEEIRAIVARRGARAPEDLVPDVEAVMTRYGVTGMNRDGVLLWIEQAITEAAVRRGQPPRP